MRPHRLQPTRLSHPWDSPGKNTGVGCHCLLQCMKVKVKSCPTPSDPVGCSLPGSSIHGTFPARVLEWVAIVPTRAEPVRYIHLWSRVADCWYRRSEQEQPVQGVFLHWLSRQTWWLPPMGPLQDLHKISRNHHLQPLPTQGRKVMAPMPQGLKVSLRVISPLHFQVAQMVAQVWVLNRYPGAAHITASEASGQ